MPFTLENYRGLEVVTPDPTGDGGLAIQNDFIKLVDWNPQSVWNATSDPTVDDDEDHDFFRGSLWLRTDTTPPQLYLCTVQDAGAAVWEPVHFVGNDVTFQDVVTVTKAAETGEDEFILRFKVSDDTDSSLTINNTTNAADTFSPGIDGAQGDTHVGLVLSGTIGSDTGTSPCLLLLSRVSGGSDVSTRPCVGISNRNTALWQIMGDGQIKRFNGTTRESNQIVASVATTDATQTTAATITISSNNTYLIEARIVARRTGGSSGTADDGASYVRRGTYTTKSGTVTLLGSLQTIGTDVEDQAGWDATMDINGSTVRVRVTGAANNNVTWFVDATVQRVGS